MENTEKQKKNKEDYLVKWKPGQSGNPAGRPKGQTLTELLRKALFNIPDNEKQSVANKFIDSVVEQALKGDDKAQKLVFNYIDGLPKQDIQVGGELKINVVNYGDMDELEKEENGDNDTLPVSTENLSNATDEIASEIPSGGDAQEEREEQDGIESPNKEGSA